MLTVTITSELVDRVTKRLWFQRLHLILNANENIVKCY